MVAAESEDISADAERQQSTDAYADDYVDRPSSHSYRHDHKCGGGTNTSASECIGSWPPRPHRTTPFRDMRRAELLERSRSMTDIKYRRTIVRPRSSLSSTSHCNNETVGDTNSATLASSHSGSKSFTRSQKLTLACLALIHFGVYLSMSIIAPFFPIEAELKGISLSTTGYVFSCYALVMVITSPFAGKIMAVLGVKRSLISGLFLASGCNILFGSLNFIDDVTTFTTLCFALRTVEAIGATAFFTAAWTTIADGFPDDIGYVFGLMETFVGLGMTIGPALGGALYSLGGYGLPFYSLGTFMMLTIPVCALILSDPCLKKSSDSDSSASFVKLLKLPGVLSVSLAVTVLCSIWGFLDPTLEPHVRDYGVSPQTTGVLFLLMGGTYSISCPIVGYICDKWGFEFTMMSTGSLLTAVCLLLMGPSLIMPAVPSVLWLNIIAIVLLGFTLGIGLIPSFQSMLNEAYKGGFEENTVTYGMVSIIFSATSSLGEFLGPAIGGTLFEYYSFDFACTSIAFVCVVTALTLAVFGSFIHLYPAKNRGGSSYASSRPSPIRHSLSDSGIFDSNEKTPLVASSVHYSHV